MIFERSYGPDTEQYRKIPLLSRGSQTQQVVSTCCLCLVTEMMATTKTTHYLSGERSWYCLERETREARLRWYGHVRRKDDVNIGRRMLRMELPGKRKRGGPKRRFMDVVKEDMAVVEVMEEDAEGRTEGRWKIQKKKKITYPVAASVDLENATLLLALPETRPLRLSSPVQRP